MVSVFLEKTEEIWEIVYFDFKLKYIHIHYELLFVKHFLRCTFTELCVKKSDLVMCPTVH
jgi:hypothetical protein